MMQVIRQYAESSGNFHLLSLLNRFDGFKANQPTPQGRRLPKPVRQVLSEKERDYGSILSVLDRLGRPVGSADLGRFRRRWLEYPPRNPNSGFRNRLEEALATMTKEGVLTAIRTAKGAYLYSPGPNAGVYQHSAVG